MSLFVLFLVNLLFCGGGLSFIFMIHVIQICLLFVVFVKFKFKLLWLVFLASRLEGGQTLLHCPDGQYVGFTHGRYFYNSCGADVTRTLSINCCNHQSCLIKATNDWLGVDPCVGDTKTLEWTMICRGK